MAEAGLSIMVDFLLRFVSAKYGGQGHTMVRLVMSMKTTALISHFLKRHADVFG